MPSLRIKLPNNQGEVTHVLAGGRITIGRRPDNTIQIVDGTVSAHHAELIGVNGHYRLHDLGSTNLTCVEGEPVTDFHLHGPCKVMFGKIEAEYSPDTPTTTGPEKAEMVPTRSEMEFLRRENLDLRSELAALKKQVDILGSARLVTKETTQLGIQPEVHRRLLAERDTLRAENARLQHEAEHTQADLLALRRDRDATRQAWETVKAELAELQGGGSAPLKIAPAAPAPAATPADTHRHMAEVLGRAPGIVQSLRATLEKLSASPTNATARATALNQAQALADTTAVIPGHPVQRLSNALEGYLGEVIDRPAPLDAEALRPIVHAAEVLPGLFAPAALKRAEGLPRPRILALDDDPDLLASLIASLEMADLKIVAINTAAQAIAELRGRAFDLIFLDIAMPDANGLDVCKEIRAMAEYRETPIIFLSGNDSPENRAQSVANGGSDFVAKPFRVLDLTLRAETWIYKHQFGLM